MNEYVQLEKEIESLRHELSVTIPQEIQTAKETGDLRENTEFSEILTRQTFASIRLNQLLTRLKAYKSIDINTIPHDKVGIGSIVKVRHLESDKIVYFKLVVGDIHSFEVNKYEEITINSPIGKSLLDKKVKDEVLVSLPKGKATYRILQINTIHGT